LFSPELWDEQSPLHQAKNTGQPVKPTLVTSVRGWLEREGDARSIFLGAAPLKQGYLLSLHEGGPLYQMKAERLSDLSHDVRAPVAAIRAYAELLADEIDDGDPEVRRLCLETIDQRACHLTDLIVNLTDMIRLELGYFQPSKRRVSLRDLAEEAISTLRIPAQQQDVRVILDSPVDLPPISADRHMMDTLFKALISNAIKFSNACGEVVVSLRSDGENQTITVTDQGLGIAPDDLPYIFDVFYRGRAAREGGCEGIGLGLTLARAIVKAHNGQIDVASDEGRGTCFAVTLPP
jgi:signal transduction histidine kinase